MVCSVPQKGFDAFTNLGWCYVLFIKGLLIVVHAFKS